MGINTELQRCISILQSGGLLVAPSDTVYGLVCDATNEEAVKKLIAVKNRPWGKPISVFTDGFEMMSSLVELGSHKALLQTLLPGPFTIILPSKHKVCSLLESERKTL
ncbi:MAG: Sua5/YciO/YrdC/YwlC family protein, partial [Candidatus Roizmanbacteria bacterium]|nr:Sua5/YciO/YrdC/YwlC family protein [Candidatus Roizmanbacteria bacterium]